MSLTKTSAVKLNDGSSIPIAGYGVFQLARGETKVGVIKALQAGYRHIDTAIYYENQEEVAEGIAQFLKETKLVKRSDIYFTTKVLNNSGYAETQEAVEKISREVKSHIGYVDLVLIHNPMGDRLNMWSRLQDYVVDPKNTTLEIKSIGVSNYGIKHLLELLEWEGLLVKPVVNQLELHPWLPHTKLVQYSLANGIHPEAYAPITRGKKFNDAAVLGLSKKYNLTPAQVLLTWGYLKGFIVLAKTATPSRLKENLDALPDKIDSTGERDADILSTLDYPDSHEVVTWGGKDPTLHE